MILSIAKGIGDKLSAASAVTAVVSTRIYVSQPPLEAPLPFVQIELAGGGDDNASPLDSFDVLVNVKCVATSGAVAAGCADAIRAALHNAALTLESPWTAYDCQHETAFLYVENEGRIPYTHSGGSYRIRAYRSS